MSTQRSIACHNQIYPPDGPTRVLVWPIGLDMAEVGGSTHPDSGGMWSREPAGRRRPEGVRARETRTLETIWLALTNTKDPALCRVFRLGV